MTPFDYIVEGALIGAGGTLLALWFVRNIRAQLVRIVEKRFERNLRTEELARDRIDLLRARNTIKIEARGDRLHVYICKCCGKQVVGLDYCLPRGWQPGYMLGEVGTVEYACSQVCLEKLADETEAQS